MAMFKYLHGSSPLTTKSKISDLEYEKKKEKKLSGVLKKRVSLVLPR